VVGSIRPGMLRSHRYVLWFYMCGMGCSFKRFVLFDCRSEDSSEGEARKTSKKSYELCAGAANHLTSIGTFFNHSATFLVLGTSICFFSAMLYSDTYTLGRCSVFLCYYVFTASIMHVTSRKSHSDSLTIPLMQLPQ
jgi:hypothetical protein